jgi:hypothetical protein
MLGPLGPYEPLVPGGVKAIRQPGELPQGETATSTAEVVGGATYMRRSVGLLHSVVMLQ